MTHTICRECKCQALCIEKGCIPVTCEAEVVTLSTWRDGVVNNYQISNPEDPKSWPMGFEGWSRMTLDGESVWGR